MELLGHYWICEEEEGKRGLMLSCEGKGECTSWGFLHCVMGLGRKKMWGCRGKKVQDWGRLKNLGSVGLKNIDLYFSSPFESQLGAASTIPARVGNFIRNNSLNRDEMTII